MKFIKRWWLAACFITITMCSLTLIIIPTSITIRNSLSSLAHDIMINISSYTLDKSENYLLPAQKAAELTRFLADSEIVSSDSPQSMINYFYQQLSLYPQFTSVYYGNIKGEFFMASRSNPKSPGGYYTKIIRIDAGQRKCTLHWTDSKHKTIDSRTDPDDRYDPRSRPWFIDALMDNTVVWTSPYLFFTGKKPGITTASPVYDPNGELQGVVGVDISLEELSIFLSRLTIGTNGKAFIVNSSGDVVAFPDLKELKHIGKNDNKIRLSKISELKDAVSRKAYESLQLPPDQLPVKSVFTSFEHEGNRYSAMFTPFTDSQWPWLIGIYIPENDYLGGIKSTRRSNSLIALLVVAAAGFVGWAVARKLETTKEEAIKANNAKSRFLAVMSHEIRTPMNIILGATDLLGESEINERQKKYIELLHNAGTGLLELLNDILDMSKVEAGLLELEEIRFNPRALLKQVSNVFSIVAENKGIYLTLDMDRDFPAKAIGDPVRIKQVLMNLIGNAVKFTSKGGVTVRAHATSSIRTGRVKLVFAVMDTGTGIPEDQHEAIFESFTQADKSITRQHAGTGLGLSISRKLSQLMGGNIILSSQPGNGSTFTFMVSLDACVEDSKTDDFEEIVTEENSTPKKVLLIEDNKSNRLLFSHYLHDSQHLLVTAENGQVGVEKFKQERPDIVFMDIEMPIMDGYMATSMIREWEKSKGLPRTPIIALSAHALKGTEDAVITAGCSGYMTKPVSKIQLIDRIERKR